MDKTDMQILSEHIERLEQKNQQQKQDIEKTVSYIARLLTDLGLLTPDFEFQFSMKKLTRSVLPIITNPGSAQERFSYLADLREIIEKYGKSIQQNQLQNEKEVS